MNTLIVYASKYGSTEKCAELVKKELKAQAELVDLKKVKNINLSQYDRVIVGGAVYMGKIRKEAAEFCSKYISELKEKKLGLFICGMVEGEAINAELSRNFPSELLKIAQAKEYLGGEFLIDRMNFIEKIIVKNVSKVTSNKSSILSDKIHEFAQAMN